MMQKHLAELRAQLEAQGMTITDAEIRERGDRTEQSGDRDSNAHRGEGNESRDDVDGSPAHGLSDVRSLDGDAARATTGTGATWTEAPSAPQG